VTWVSPLVALRDQVKGRARFSDRPRPPRALEPVGTLLAGAVDVDITPPPGMPKAGYSANAHNGSGFRTRLRARIIHLRTDEASVALVQCDLLGGSAVVQHLVAAAIAEATDVPLAGVFIGATHTHAGPGQYLGTDFYNRFASNQSGFDPGYAQFLVERISGGIIEAVAGRAPARLAFGTTEVWGLTRNRSLDAHIRNDAVTDPSTPAQRKFHAVNPELHLLRVDTVDGAGDSDQGTTLTPLAAMVVFSVHGTGVPMQADEYNADIWAYLVGELKQRVAATTGTTPIIGAVEGTHADVAPAIRPGAAGHLEAARIGRGVGAEAAVLYDRLAGELRGDIELAAGLREVDLTTSRTIEGITLPDRPAVGAALVAGAHENLTPVVNRIPPFAAGHPKRWGTDNPQGAKWIIGSRWLQPIVLPLKSFPRVLPVQVLRIGPTWVVGLPFELTVETGRLIAGAVTTALGGDGDGAETDHPPHVVVSSVANEYSGYAATAREYELQCYEGAHTLYGPSTQPFLAAQAAHLAAEVAAASTAADRDHPAFVQDVLAERSFDLKLVHHLPRADPASRAASTPRRFDAEAQFVDPTRSTDGFWQAEWLDVPPVELHWHEPVVRVEASDDGGATWVPAVRDGRTVDDQGWDLQVTAVGDASGADAHRYRVRWWDPAFKGGRSFRFVLAANNGRPELASAAFR